MSTFQEPAIYPASLGLRPRTRYRAVSWIDPRTVRRHSTIEGTGLFATAPIACGEVVVIWGGTLFSDAQVRAGIARERSCVLVAEGLHLGLFAHEPEGMDEFMNHACRPNVWLRDEVTLVARTNIATGEELTIDYALWETDPDWAMPCFCRQSGCRGWVTGNDWMSTYLQREYGNHFSPYVNLRIKHALSMGHGAA